jgi:stage V sporulation protein B
MKRTFFANTVVLTMTTQLLRVIGLFFIAFLSDRIGTEGIGLYQLTFSVYFLASTMATSGIGVAVSRLTAESIGKSRYKSTSNVVRRALALSLFMGLLVGGVLFLFSGFIGTSLLGDGRSVISLKTLSFGLPFMSLSSCLRGYFYGVRKVMRTAGQMIFEQVAQIVILFSIINSFAHRGLEYACLAIAISASVTEALSCGYGFVMYAFERSRTSLVIINEQHINRQIFGICVPVAASSYLRAGLKTAENVLIPSGLRRYGATGGQALSQFGLLGMAMPVLLFPSSFLTAISALLLPEISEAHSIDNSQKIKNIFSRVFQFTAMLSLLFSGIFITFAKELGALIYQNEDAGMLIMMLAPLVPLIYLDFIVDSMLNGLNQQVKTLKINLLDYSIRIGLILMLIPKYGFFAYVVIYYISTVLNAFLSIRHLLVSSATRINFMEWVLKPALAVVTSGLVVKVIFRFLPIAGVSWGFLVIKIILVIVLYMAILFIIQCVGREDIIWLKGIVHGKKGRQIDNDISYQELIK